MRVRLATFVGALMFTAGVATPPASADPPLDPINPCSQIPGDTELSCETYLRQGSGSPGPTQALPEVSIELEVPEIPLAPLAAGAEHNGTAVSPAGDLNADGLPDILSGAPGSTVGSGPRARVEAGAVLVYLGSTDFDDLAQADIVFKGATRHERVGVAVAGNFDFDGDGRPDILIGGEQFNRSGSDDPVAGCDDGAPCGAGVAYLIFFKPEEYPHLADPGTIDFVDLAQVGTPGSPISGVKLTGSDRGDRAGFAVAGGGRIDAGIGQDIAIGAPGADPGAPRRPEAGRAYVIFDDPTLEGLTIALDQVANVALPPEDRVAGVVYEGTLPGDALGFAVAFPGSVVGDAIDDVALGAPLADPPELGETAFAGTLRDAGTVYVVLGGGISSSIIETCDIGPGGVAGSQVLGDQAGMQLGFALAGAGDALVDGEPELLMGAPGFDVASAGGPPRVDAGLEAHTAGALPMNGIIETCDIGGPGGIPGVIYTGSKAGDLLGGAVAGTGDVTRDGFDDVALAAPLSDPLPETSSPVDAGTVYVVEGFEATRGDLGVIDASQIGVSVGGIQLVGVEAGERAGSAVARCGDVSGDGQPDLLVGAPDNDLEAPDSGLVYAVLSGVPLPLSACGAAGCTLVDLSTGAQLVLPPGAVPDGVPLSVKGLLEPLDVPPVVPGKTFLGATRLGPPAGVLAIPATVWIPLRVEIERQFVAGEPLPLSHAAGSGWVDSGIMGQVVPHPLRPGSLAVQAPIGTLRTYGLSIPDADADGYGDGRDCDPSPLLWAVPSEARLLTLSHDPAAGPRGATTLTWTVPALPGAKAAVLYDALRSGDPADFEQAAACLEANGPDTVAVDDAEPASGAVAYYLVRAENGCAADGGSLGESSSGEPRTARSCSP